MKKQKQYSLTMLPFILIHILAVAGLWAVEFSWTLLAICAATYVVGMWAVTAGYHRYFSHRSYKTSRPFQFFLAVLAQTTGQKGALWWAANHRHHHKYSDQPEDVHSPRQRGFIWSHVGWVVAHEFDGTQWDRIRDFAKFPELVWLNKYPLTPTLLYGALLYFIGGLPLLVYGGIVPLVVLWHGTFTINSFAHIFGRRRYDTTDDSKNSLILALITLGEGWHNNHHHYQHSVRQGFFWWEIDVTYAVLKVLSWLGLVWDLRGVPDWAVAGHDSRADAIQSAAFDPQTDQPVQLQI